MLYPKRANNIPPRIENVARTNKSLNLLSDKREKRSLINVEKVLKLPKNPTLMNSSISLKPIGELIFDVNDIKRPSKKVADIFIVNIAKYLLNKNLPNICTIYNRKDEPKIAPVEIKKKGANKSINSYIYPTTSY